MLPLATAVRQAGHPVRIQRTILTDLSFHYSHKKMEAMNAKVFFAALVVALVALSAVQGAAAVDTPAPAPGPSSDAAAVVPAAFASAVALAFGFLF
nr:arabinogalactan peptide 12 [Ipomoea batatas]